MEHTKCLDTREWIANLNISILLPVPNFSKALIIVSVQKLSPILESFLGTKL